LRAVSLCRCIRLEYFRTYDGTLTRREQEEQAEPEMVCIQVVKRLAERFRVFSYHDSQLVKTLPGGVAEVSCNVTGAREMIPWLTSWGPAVQVLEPEWLRQTLGDHLENTLACYKSHETEEE